ncbi:lantibiotic immunity ABC transporter MutE/EpiE family permease subunit [Clostridium sp. UBA6640]|uniref:lantibiotic immunity ABC transporter MutE/EpiE family permease subunit n=1 Tax=Clostridium sp. UBA6640 TaxID=1946370 RepID=UPI0025B92268|nr:lantibiotic immunity ABC transporter MutE/EpiE family permease subunit [Clostridium sp. UBA6640]
MANYLKAELLKQKHSFNKKIIWLVPVVNIIIACALMGVNYIQTASYNWWYVSFLPFTFTYVSSSIINKDKKFNFHGLFGIAEDKKQLWYAKILTSTIYLFIACFIFLALITVCGFIFNEQISILDNLCASVLLFITFAWQIPLFMFITLKINMFFSVLLSVGCNLFIACICAVESYWWIPFSIPARVMCPVIKVLPNGLLMPMDSLLDNNNVIWIGVLITVTLYTLISVVTAKIFEKQEV